MHFVTKTKKGLCCLVSLVKIKAFEALGKKKNPVCEGKNIVKLFKANKLFLPRLNHPPQRKVWCQHRVRQRLICQRRRRLALSKPRSNCIPLVRLPVGRKHRVVHDAFSDRTQKVVGVLTLRGSIEERGRDGDGRRGRRRSYRTAR